ncbi:hypothetical protein CEXT_259301 [Caerostris extrusa]|uniref:Uncharacterized protein n=1 Tax=Caerostris extrusa TaxID=172846 RepID=A0AAV4TP30_CAEEX|nr:hypothetical protein CEXT_259301 [Caerostris extrusa]
MTKKLAGKAVAFVESQWQLKSQSRQVGFVTGLNRLLRRVGGRKEKQFHFRLCFEWFAGSLCGVVNKLFMCRRFEA